MSPHFLAEEYTSDDCSSSTASEDLHLEEVAVIGMACRTSGGNKSPEQLWNFLLNKQHGSGTVPAFRWEPWLRRDPRNAKEMELTLRKGYFIEDLENFDAAFFGISPKEAEQMDPHQRLGLELAWEALEHAGINAKDLSRSNTAVYMGVDSDDYSRLLMEDLPNIEPWMGIGTAAHGIANRISYHLDLMGPSAAVDAACASSLVAVHHGSTAIQIRESEVAIVGGVNVLLAPALTRMLDKAGALSQEGICRSFDDAANGYARGEGGAVLILKRLSSAIKDGDHIWSVLKGSAIAQDGKTNGIMAPNSAAQELVGRQALKRAHLHPSNIDYVEAHATSTPLGDPTEITAISRLYGAQRHPSQPCKIGSIKPNVGHLEAAAGTIGLIKAVMAVEKGQLAPQTLLEKPTTRIDWQTSGLEIVRETTEWNSGSDPRRAAICSYGYGGTVSHAIIEQYMPANSGQNQLSEAIDKGLIMLTLTAPSEKRLHAHAKGLAEWLGTPQGRGADLRYTANTLAQRRATHAHRLAFLVKDHDDAIEILRRVESKSVKKSDPFVSGRILPPHPSQENVHSHVWVFSGHGAQWLDMGREIIGNSVFRTAMEEIEDVIEQEGGFSITKSLEKGDFETTERAQIATFAIQFGLTQILRSHGLEPSAVVGHSIGEICAAVAAGCITPREGAFIVTRRSNLLTAVRGSGAMALVQQPFDQVKAALGARSDVVVAIDSSPSSCVISGQAAAVEAYVQQLQDRDVETFKVNSDIGFHSPMLDELKAPFRKGLLAFVKPTQPKIPIYSTSLDDPRGVNLRDADYWVNNMVNPVWLKTAVQAAAADGYRTFLEVSSHPILTHSIRETLRDVGLKDTETITACTMRRNLSSDQTIKMAMAQLYVSGVQLDFTSLLGPKGQWCRDVPATPWMQKPYYREVKTGSFDTMATHDPEAHSLLGQSTLVSGTDIQMFTTRLSIDTKPFPGTHPLDGTEIVPAGVYVNTFHNATGSRELSNIQLRIPVSMTKEVQQLQVVVRNDQVSIATKAPGSGKESWIMHAGCEVAGSPVKTMEPLPPVSIEAVRERIGTQLPNSFAVDYLTKIGVSGIAFPWQVVEHYGNEAEMLVKVDNFPEHTEAPWDPFSWAPLLDAATSVGSSIFFTQPRLRIISNIEKVKLHSTKPLPKIIYLFVQRDAGRDSATLAANVQILDDSGEVLVEMEGMILSDVEAEGTGNGEGSMDRLVHQIDWIPCKFAEAPRSLGHVVLVSDGSDRVASMKALMGAVAKSVTEMTCAADLEDKSELLQLMSREQGTVIYVPGQVQDPAQVSTAADDFVWETVSLLRIINDKDLAGHCKLFVMADGVHKGSSTTGLAHGALVGLGRIIAAEHPDIWGGLIDNDDTHSSPLLALTYAESYDIIRNIDGLPRRAMMRPLDRKRLHASTSHQTLCPRGDGTYIVTGGMGFLGLKTAESLVKKGARRILLISRSGLPPRSSWDSLVASNDKHAKAILSIRQMETSGAAITALALDISVPNASEHLHKALDTLQLPRVKGVVHCAGVLEDSLVLKTPRDSFRRVMSPKVSGALTLHEAFPPGELDFFVMYSSIGQLVGTAGQASYGAGNAFLDALAAHRRQQKDNTVAMQFTALRGEGMGASSEFLQLELQSKGITDITSEQAFSAWEHLGKFDIASAVVTGTLEIEEGEDIAVPILEHIVRRRPRSGPVQKEQVNDAAPAAAKTESRPSDPEALVKWLDDHLKECIAAVLMMPDASEIDSEVSMNDLGLDSVMTVSLRKKFQSFFGVKVPPTLTWRHPTVASMVPWFQKALVGE